MIAFAGRGILLDVEGTTSAVAYVYDVMFPYARRRVAEHLATHMAEPATADACEQIAREAGHASVARMAADGADQAAAVEAQVLRLMDADVKSTGLKQLQGLIWRAGFESGELRAHVYPDVPPALAAWRAAGVDLRVYSSGSVQAQQLFFGHTDCGDLLRCFSGHYDTTTGPKRDAASYQKIAQHWPLPAGEVLFLSDTVAELDAAHAAGMQTGLVVRDTAVAPAPAGTHPAITSFDAVSVTRQA
ncbi:MAG: acireductone synthase [Planctomycetota bacterium]